MQSFSILLVNPDCLTTVYRKQQNEINKTVIGVAHPNISERTTQEKYFFFSFPFFMKLLVPLRRYLVGR